MIFPPRPRRGGTGLGARSRCRYPEAAPRLEHLKDPRLLSPLAWTVIGGLIVSAVLTPLILPAVYSLLDRGR